jgi:predicted MFS family arabinose efflux permease
MIPPRIKNAAFVLEGMNSVFVTLYFYFIFWFLKSEYGFGSRENLLWAVGNGFVYVIGSIQGGRFGQRKGYLRALRVGFAGLSVCLFLGWLLNRAGLSHPVEIPLQALVMVLATVFVCFTWPIWRPWSVKGNRRRASSG